MRETFDATDEQTRFEHQLDPLTHHARSLSGAPPRSRPVPAIAFEGLLGLAEIAPEYELDGYQMRHLPGPGRTCQTSSRAGIDRALAPAIAMDSSAEHAERTERPAMQLGRAPRPALAPDAGLDR